MAWIVLDDLVLQLGLPRRQGSSNHKKDLTLYHNEVQTSSITAHAIERARYF